MYFVKRIDPWSFTEKDAIECGEVMVEAFRGDALTEYTGAETHRLHSTAVIQSIQDPRDRLNKMVQQAKLYRYLVYSWSRLIWKRVLKTGSDIYTICDSEDANRIIGFAVWTYPKHMVQNLDEKLGKVGLKWWFFSTWMNLKLTIKEKFARGWFEHPFLNPRLFEFAAEMHKLCRKSISTVQEVISSKNPTSCIYPEKHMVYLMLFATHPGYQRKGLGKQLMVESMESIPNVVTPFDDKVSGQYAEGPQKLYLEATAPGLKLYSKVGFESKLPMKFQRGNITIESTYMVLTR